MTDLPLAVLDAFEVAQEVADRFPGTVILRLIDPDAFLDPSWMPHRAPRRSVEVFVGALGVLVVATDRGERLYVEEVLLPPVLDESGGLLSEDETALHFAVLWQVRRAMLAIAQQVAPRARGLLGP